MFNFNSVGECILVGRSMEGDLQAAHQFAWWLVAAGGAILLLGLGGGWWLATGALRPIEHMAATAAGRAQPCPHGHVAARHQPKAGLIRRPRARVAVRNPAGLGLRGAQRRTRLGKHDDRRRPRRCAP